MITTSKDLLTQLMAEIDATDPGLLPPPHKIEKGEKIIGIVSDEYLRKIFSLCNFCKRECQRMQVDFQAIGEEPTSHAEFVQMKQKYESLIEMFWLLLRHHMNFWSSGIGIRREWTVVDTGSKSENPLLDSLKKFLNED